MAEKRAATKATPKRINRVAEVDVKPTVQAPRQEPSPVDKETSSDTKSVTVYITNTGSKYHAGGCRHLKSKIGVSLEEAKSRGLTPCKVCGGGAGG